MTTQKIGDVVIRKIVKNVTIKNKEDDGEDDPLTVNPLQKSTQNDNATIVLKKELPFKNPKQVLDLDKCRICNDKKGIISIFGNVQLHLAKEIFKFSGVRVHSTDKLPQKICQRCLDLLNGCIMFRDMCQRTNSLLFELIEKKESKNDFGVIVQIRRIKDEDDIADVNIVDSDEDFDYPIQARNPDDEETYKQSRETSIHTRQFEIQETSIHTNSTPEFEIQETYIHTDSTREFKIQKPFRHTNSTRKFESPPKNKKPKRKRKWNPDRICADLCEICGKGLRGPKDYELHKNIHDNIFPYQCDLCPYRGRTKDLLSTHLKSHLPDEEKPFKCPHCPYAVTTASNLQRHIKCRHSTARPFKCDHCGKTFTLRSALTKHIRFVHSNAKGILYSCDMCTKVYVDRHHLTRHRRLIHNITPQRFGRWPAYLLAQKKKESENEEQIEVLEEIWDDDGQVLQQIKSPVKPDQINWDYPIQTRLPQND